jgi:hypothetical protein
VITEDLDLFFADFGVSFTAGAISGMCIKDMSGLGIIDGQIINPGHQVLVKTSLFGNLLYNAYVTVAGEAYTVKEALPVEDGAFSLVALEKVSAEEAMAYILDGGAAPTPTTPTPAPVDFIYDGGHA